MLENKDRVLYTVYYPDTEDSSLRFQQLLGDCDGMLISNYTEGGNCTANITIDRRKISKLEKNQFLFGYLRVN